MNVFLLWHVRHAEYVDGRPTQHFDTDGDIIFDENARDSLNILGIFTSEAGAQARIDLAKIESGFKDEPECFSVAPYTLDEPLLVGGIHVYEID